MIASLVAVVSSLSALSAAPALGQAQAKPPNVVFIVSDDQGWGDYSFMGHEAIRTPHLDKLASQSLLLTRGYVPTSLCRPSLATIMTGLYPHQHRITGNDPDKDLPKDLFEAKRREMVQAFEKSPALPRLLASKGYVSFQTGKWWEGSPGRAGFTASMSHGDTARGGRHGDEGLKVGRETLQPMFDFMDSAAAAGKPFFLWYAPMMPHNPHNPPQRLLDKYTRPDRPIEFARYFAMCEWFDETCGQLLDYLDKKNFSGNTLVVYVADNGWVQSTTPHPAFGGLRGKRSPYDGGIRTPIMLRWPWRINPRRDEQTLAGSIDLMPTVLAACGLATPGDLPGLNLLDPAAISKRDTLLGEIYTHDVRDLAHPAASLNYRWAIHKNWKLILPHGSQDPPAAIELFDLADDPQENNNLAARHPQRVADLRQRIQTWWPTE